MRHSLSRGGAPLSCGFDRKSCRDMHRRCRSAASNARCACSLGRGYLVFLADGCRLPTEANQGRTEAATRTTWRRARSRCHDRRRLEENSRQTAAASTIVSWKAKRAESHRRLARTLRSARYRHLIKSASGWIESGPWSTKKGKQVPGNALPRSRHTAPAN